MPTAKHGRIAQLVRAFASHARGLGFEPQCVHQTTNRPTGAVCCFMIDFGLGKQGLF